jgi:glutamyl-tRNA synthetase
MTVRVRFAPSPTGLLHIGGARTALYCYLIAKAKGGKFILRVEDTDLERSKREYEEDLVSDLKWLGITYDEGPDCPGDYGPYRQSERLDMYKSLSWQLVEKGMAYPCFLTQEEIEKLSEQAIAEKKSPHAYHGKYRDLTLEEAKAKIEKGDEHVIRFKNPGKKYSFKDLVRGEVTFPEDMVGDFVIMRANGMPVYNFCCVVDDWKMGMTHVIRAEEHLNNTVRQLMIYEALEADVPQFAHCSLLVGEDRQKLSKRHGATSVKQYIDQGYLPQALNNYLCLLGWTHPEEKDIWTLEEITPLFDLNRFHKAPALYDIQKLNFFNGEHLRLLNETDLKSYLASGLKEDHPFHQQSEEWKDQCSQFFKEKINLPSELALELEVLFREGKTQSEEMSEIESWESTNNMREYLASEINKLSSFATIEDFNSWTQHIKKELKIKGKPLFKGMRALLTGQAEGPDLKTLVVLTPLAVLKSRFS